MENMAEKKFSKSGIDFKSVIKLEDHKQVYAEETTFARDMCFKNAELASNLKTHKLVETKKQKSYTKRFSCEICLKSFHNKCSLLRHKHGYETKPFSCDICFKRYCVLTSLKRHKLSHDKNNEQVTVEEFTCDVCSKSFKTPISLKTHKKIHSQGAFFCVICSRNFRMNSSLKTHLRVHTQEKPFACDICFKSFGAKKSMEKHILAIHKKAKPFTCDICLKKFSEKCKLKHHKFVHELRRHAAIGKVKALFE